VILLCGNIYRDFFSALDHTSQKPKHCINFRRSNGKRAAWQPCEVQCNSEKGINLLTPNVNYSGRTAPLTSKVAFYIFIQQI